MTDTAVVGAGIGGLAAAILVSRAGHAVTVYEQHASVPSGGAALMLQPNGLAVLDAIGVLDELRSVGSELRSLRLLDDRLRLVSEVEIPGGPAHGYALVVTREAVRSALLGATEEAGIVVATDHELSSIDAEPSRPVLHFGEADAAVELVVGADGGNSAVREVFAGEGAVDRAGRRYLRSLVAGPCPESLIGEYWTRRGIAGMLPCGDELTYWYATATPSIERAADAGDLARFRRAVAAAHPPLLQVVNAVTALDQVGIAPTRWVAVDQLYHDTIVLIGDAAHAMAPNLGQGANSALVDAGVLASELGRRDELTDALAAYDARRCSAVKRVQTDAERLARLAHFTRGRRVRNAALRMLPARFGIAATERAQQVDLATFRAELKALARTE